MISPATPAAPSVWPMFDFTDPTRHGRTCRSSAPHHGTERAELDGVAGCRAGAVRLDVLHGRRVDPGAGVGPAQHLLLAALAGRGTKPPLRPSLVTALPRMTA